MEVDLTYRVRSAFINNDMYREFKYQYKDSDGKPRRFSVLGRNPQRLFGKSVEVAYVYGNRVYSDSATILDFLEQKIPGIKTRLIA